MPEGAIESAEVEISRPERRGMIMIRASLEDEKAANAIGRAFSADIPAMRRITGDSGRNLAWMSPDELLGFVPLENAKTCLQDLRDALAGFHHLVTDVTSLREEFELNGAVRDVLAKGTPSDVSPQVFEEGEFRRSRIGQLQAAFWLTGPNSARILCRRSEAGHMQDWLAAASSPDRSPKFFHR